MLDKEDQVFYFGQLFSRSTHKENSNSPPSEPGQSEPAQKQRPENEEKSLDKKGDLTSPSGIL